MYTRTVDCTIKPELKEEFSKAVVNQVLPPVKKASGFIELMCLFSDEKPDHATVITFWKSKSDADDFYRLTSPMVELLHPYLKTHSVEHFVVEFSTTFKIAAGKAA